EKTTTKIPCATCILVSEQRLFDSNFPGAALCPSWQTECEKGDGADQFTMRYSNKASYQYRLTNPPKALLKASLDNIAIVPSSMLTLTDTLKEKVNTFPKGAVVLCYAAENTRQQKLLERVGETFREHGHIVRSLSMKEVYKAT